MRRSCLHGPSVDEFSTNGRAAARRVLVRLPPGNPLALDPIGAPQAGWPWPFSLGFFWARQFFSPAPLQRPLDGRKGADLDTDMYERCDTLLARPFLLVRPSCGGLSNLTYRPTSADSRPDIAQPPRPSIDVSICGQGAQVTARESPVCLASSHFMKSKKTRRGAKKKDASRHATSSHPLILSQFASGWPVLHFPRVSTAWHAWSLQCRGGVFVIYFSLNPQNGRR